ncbi:hypothetical protein Csa_020845 [Cucumis sativus]|nr:hypothetical protein Csa_020845 [Cucumis sativus]
MAHCAGTDNQVSFMPELDSPTTNLSPPNYSLQARAPIALPPPVFLQLPHFQSPKIPTSFATNFMLRYTYNQGIGPSSFSHGATFQVPPNSGGAATVSECDRKDTELEFGLASPSSCQGDMWK